MNAEELVDFFTIQYTHQETINTHLGVPVRTPDDRYRDASIEERTIRVIDIGAFIDTYKR
ncbi:MAG: hypothetical protein ACE5DX_02920 [Candidatus Dojkabacteria bacterium]